MCVCVFDCLYVWNTFPWCISRCEYEYDYPVNKMNLLFSEEGKALVRRSRSRSNSTQASSAARHLASNSLAWWRSTWGKDRKDNDRSQLAASSAACHLAFNSLAWWQSTWGKDKKDNDRSQLAASSATCHSKLPGGNQNYPTPNEKEMQKVRTPPWESEYYIHIITSASRSFWVDVSIRSNKWKIKPRTRPQESAEN